jgi:hypothetical protein
MDYDPVEAPEGDWEKNPCGFTASSEFSTDHDVNENAKR